MFPFVLQQLAPASMALMLGMGQDTPDYEVSGHDPEQARLQRIHRQLVDEPEKTGDALLVGGATAVLMAVGAGATHWALRTRDRIDPECDFLCRPETGGKLFAGSMLLMGSGTGLGLGIAGSVYRGRYDAWRARLGHGPAIDTMPYYVAGSVLTASGAVLVVSAAAIGISGNVSRPVADAIPGFLAGASATLTPGLGLLAYAASYQVRFGKIGLFTPGLMLDARRQTLGLRIRGRF